MDDALIVVTSAEGVRQFAIGDKAVTVGRSPENDVLVTDVLASRFHCVIEASAEGIRIRDLKSRNGTLLNGKKVETAVLADGDVVKIGQTIFTFKPIADNPNEVQVIDEPETPSKKKALPVLGEEQEDELPWGEYDMKTAPKVEVASEAVPENPVGTLFRMAQSLTNRSIGEGDIHVANARGQPGFSNTVGEAAAGTGAGLQRPGNEVPSIFRLILLICLRQLASDIHIEPRAEEFAVRIRVDGNMVDLIKLKKETGVRLCAIVKVLCDLNIGQRNKVQEGHFSATIHAADSPANGESRRVDYRVSFAPSVFGQKLVIRVLDTTGVPLQVADLNMPAWMAEEIKHAIAADAGMILVCGPTGCGKTTTLYSMLRTLNVSERNVVTIEDPVEIQISGVTQLPVQEDQGKGFSALLKSVLRQDPDVILIGEIRDAETAKIAMQGAITGHLLFSTLHTKDTIGAIFRLFDLGVEPYSVAQGLHLIVAQRLIRMLCPYCKVAAKPTAGQLARLQPLATEPVKKIYLPQGCSQCLQTGFAGRRAVFELLGNTEALREVIIRNPGAGDILKAISNTPFSRLSDTGYQLVAQGLVPFDEMERVVGK